MTRQTRTIGINNVSVPSAVRKKIGGSLILPGGMMIKIGDGVRVEEAARTSIVGIDPGYGRCGWGVIHLRGNRMTCADCGVVETRSTMPFCDRLTVLHKALAEIFLVHQPSEAAVEQLYFSKNVKTAIDVGQARGVAVLTCSLADIPVFEYKPVEIKLAVSGYGAASKQQVQRMVKVLLGMTDMPVLDDASDALAAAICHAHQRGLKARLGRSKFPAVRRQAS